MVLLGKNKKVNGLPFCQSMLERGKMKITIYDVAKKANVSIATVSKVINENGSISPRTRTRVKEVMNELHYRPNLMAAALTKQKTNTIGLIVPDITNPFHSEISRIINNLCRERDYSVTICNTDDDKEKTLNYIDQLMQRSVDGIIICSPVPCTDKVKEIIQNDFPIVLLTTELNGVNANTVLVDEYAGTYNAVDHLIRQGCQSICFLGGKGVDNNSSKFRAYNDIMTEYGLPINKVSTNHINSAVLRDSNNLEGLFDATHYDGLFACSDILAVGALHEAQRKGISVPKSLKIAGFDNTFLACITTPQITSASQPVDDMCQKAVDFIIEEIENKEANNAKITRQKILFPSRLYQRGSSIDTE